MKNQLYFKGLQLVERNEGDARKDEGLGGGANPLGFVALPNQPNPLVQQACVNDTKGMIGVGGKSIDWESKLAERAEKASRALVRIGIMTHAQIARLLNVNPGTAMRVIMHRWDLFEEQRIVSTQIKRGRYPLPNRTTKYVRLTDDAQKELAVREGIERTYGYIRSKSQGQTVKVGDILISMLHNRLLYQDWDIMLPQGEKDGIHAQIVKRDHQGDENSFELGVFIMPLKLSPWDEHQKEPVFSTTIREVVHGIMHRVTQNGPIIYTLFLAPRKYYSAILNVLVRFKRDRTRFYLLPLESFIDHPEWHLDAIVYKEARQRKSLLEDGLRMFKQIDIKGVGRLIEYEEGRQYGIVDTYVNGNIERIREWKDKQPPGEGFVATPNVYVYDPVVYEALTKLVWKTHPLKDENGKTIGSKVTIHPWPAGMITPDECEPINEPDAIPPEEPAEHDAATPDDDDHDIPVDGEEDWLDYFNNPEEW